MSPELQPMVVQYYCHMYHVTKILHCHWREFWSRDTDVYLTYICFGIIFTHFYVNFSRQKHKLDVTIGIIQLLRVSGFNFSFTS